jgi:hypothetical protein
MALATALLLVLSACSTTHNTTSQAPANGKTLSSSTPVSTAGTMPGTTPGTTTGGSILVATLAPQAPNAAGSGTARLQVNPQQQTVCFLVHATGIALPATGAQIHSGAAGATGPIVVQLTAPNAAGVSTGCTHTTTAVINNITQHPADYYVSVHNAAYPDGAVRGQLSTCGPHMNC